MPASQHVWALILAGGDGSRLRALTTKPCGTSVPKQYCSLHGGHSLLEDALKRAAAVVPLSRICTIVAEQHRQWWVETPSLVESLELGNLIVQPRNRGTAIGILYSLLHLLAKDPDAQVLVLPADHYVREEKVLRQSMLAALDRVHRGDGRPVLLGLEPDEVDAELGYVLPGEPDPLGGCCVSRFIEKPAFSIAKEIIAAGGLWNTFIIAGTAAQLMELFLPRFAALVMQMQVTLSRGSSSGSPTASWPALLDLYERLPDLDFSRDLLQEQPAKLSVLRTAPCGWSDLGTPHRVGETLQRLATNHGIAMERSPAHVNLAAQHARFVQTQVGARH
ncbi:MAG: sugar phosphate nucleotidyltransferase [Steroidobacteraceae bacterium]